jgi:diaminohydroxyphosphoribosylaminopyrimidine deaminase / 5-amino-6-(5-phosphoribosylamino)uracil reductase
MVNASVYMDRALDLAERGRGTTSPNPMVGAVVVREDGSIVGQGYHEVAGGPHAEVRALDEAGELARGATLYCTLEPCSHTGRTGPCVERIAAAGIRRVVAASLDVDTRVSGRGFEFLRQKGVDVEIGPGRARALRLNRAYFTFKSRRRPFVILKAATSLDNRIAAAPGQRTSITSEEAQRHAHAVRAEIDAVGIGSETALVDDPLLTSRHVHRRRPLTRVLFDRRLRIPAAAQVFSTRDAGPVIIVTTPEAIERNQARASELTAAGAELMPITTDGLAEAFRRLGERDVMSMVLEGGAAMHEAALRAGVVDGVHLYLAPLILGPSGVAWLGADTISIAALSDRKVIPLGPDVFMEGYVHGID